VILFLNRYDLFKKKIAYSPLSNFFESITPEMARDETKASQFIVDLYQSRLNEENSVSIHITCALDTSLCKTLFSMIIEQILNESLSDSGIF